MEWTNGNGIYVRPEPNGTWRLTVVEGRGQSRSKTSAICKTQERAVEEAWKALDARKRKAALTVGDVIEQHLAAKRADGVSEESIDVLGYRLRLLPEDVEFLRITEIDAQAYYDAYREGRKPATHTHALKQVKSLFRWAIDQGITKVNPFARVKPVGSVAAGKEQLTIDESRQLLGTCHELAPDDYGAVAVLVALYLGIRASEIVERTARDLDDGGRVLRVTRKKKRGQVMITPFALPEELQVHLKRLALASGGGLLFGGKDRHWVRREVIRLCKAAGVPQVSPHGIRGSLGSGLADQGVPIDLVRKLYGHTNSGVTTKHYVTEQAQAAGEQRARLVALQGGKA